MISYGWTVTIHFNLSKFQFSFFREEETIIYLYYGIVGRIKRDSYKVLVWMSGKYRAQQIRTLASTWLFLAVMPIFFIIQLRSILSPEGWLSETASSELPWQLAFRWVHLAVQQELGPWESGGGRVSPLPLCFHPELLAVAGLLLIYCFAHGSSSVSPALTGSTNTTPTPCS